MIRGTALCEREVGRWAEGSGCTSSTSFGLVLGSAAGTARGGEFYYVMIFGSQSSPKLLRYTHTWATFVRAVGEGPDPSNYALQVHTISWLPQSLEIHVWRPWPEPGVNLDLYQTLDVVHASQQSVTMWGPFVIEKEVYDRSLWVLQIIASGAPRYRAISRPGNLLVSDCIHAVAAVDPVFGRGHYPLIRIGKPASRYIAPDHDARPREGHRAGAVRQLLADPPAGPGSLPDRIRAAAADPQAELRAVPVPGVKHHCRWGWIGPRFDGAATSSRSRSVDAEDNRPHKPIRSFGDSDGLTKPKRVYHHNAR